MLILFIAIFLSISALPQSFSIESLDEPLNCEPFEVELLNSIDKSISNFLRISDIATHKHNSTSNKVLKKRRID